MTDQTHPWRQLAAADYRVDGSLECDMVMKGGVTSGVVCPLTVCQLATRYRLRKIGGSSAGAIAAVLAAAAEYRRQTASDGGDAGSSDDGDDVPSDASEGFRQLAALPVELGAALEPMFQPLPQTRDLADLFFVATDSTKGWMAKLATGAWQAARLRPLTFLSGVLMTLLIALSSFLITQAKFSASRLALAMILPLMVGLLLGVLASLVRMLLDGNKVFPTVDFGIADGMTQSEEEPPLTIWLSEKLDSVAGLTGRDRCLTLGDLWGPEALADEEYVANDGEQPRARDRVNRVIDLEVMTTNLTTRQAYHLPLHSDDFVFDEAEMLALFPARVVSTMMHKESDLRHPDTGGLLWCFPEPRFLPLVVMARMSLSNPFLISNVPLYAATRNDGPVVRMLFADGGISSNFPMHFFDALLPVRPTFGINLTSADPADPETLVYRPQATDAIGLPRARPFDTVGGFTSAVLNTMQDWSDSKQVMMQGYADRVVEVRLRPDEGGHNLRMSPQTILDLAERGSVAGEELLTFDWAAHRVIRYRVVMARLNDALSHFQETWQADDEALYPGLLEHYSSGLPAGDLLGDQAWRQRDRAATEALISLVQQWQDDSWPALEQDWPQKSPEVRMAPH